MNSTISGIDDAKIAKMISDIKLINNRVKELFVDLTGPTISSIAGHYDGRAAEAYKANFTKLSGRADESFSQALTTLNRKLDEFRSSYQAQDKANENVSSFMGGIN